MIACCAFRFAKSTEHGHIILSLLLPCTSNELPSQQMPWTLRSSVPQDLPMHRLTTFLISAICSAGNNQELRMSRQQIQFASLVTVSQGAHRILL